MCTWVNLQWLFLSLFALATSQFVAPAGASLLGGGRLETPRGNWSFSSRLLQVNAGVVRELEGIEAVSPRALDGLHGNGSSISRKLSGQHTLEWDLHTIHVVTYTTPNQNAFFEQWLACVMEVSAKDPAPYQLHVRSAKHMGKEPKTQGNGYQQKGDTLYTSIIGDRTAFYSRTVNALPDGATAVIMDTDVKIFRPLSELLHTCEDSLDKNEAKLMCMRNVPLKTGETNRCDGNVKIVREGCNAGFILLTATEATRAFVNAWHTEVVEMKKSRDQNSFNSILRSLPHSSSIRVVQFPETVAALQILGVGAETVAYHAIGVKRFPVPGYKREMGDKKVYALNRAAKKFAGAQGEHSS